MLKRAAWFFETVAWFYAVPVFLGIMGRVFWDTVTGRDRDWAWICFVAWLAAWVLGLFDRRRRR